MRITVTTKNNQFCFYFPESDLGLHRVWARGSFAGNFISLFRLSVVYPMFWPCIKGKPILKLLAFLTWFGNKTMG